MKPAKYVVVPTEFGLLKFHREDYPDDKSLARKVQDMRARNRANLGAKIALRAIASGELSLDAAKRLAAEALAKFPNE